MRDFNHTVNVLVKAYLKGTLEHTNCYACAVGNIICDACAYTYVVRPSNFQSIVLKENGGRYENGKFGGLWYSFFMGSGVTLEEQEIALNEIEKTGYTTQELIMIEHAFEKANEGRNGDEWMFNGLMAVVDVLAEIHGISPEAKEKSKLLFVKL